MILAALFAATCLAGSVKTAIGEGVDLTSYKTYSWLDTRLLAKTGIVDNDPVFDPLIRSAVNRELSKKGLMEVAEGGDLQVSAAAFGESIPQVEAMYFPSMPAADWGMGGVTIGRYNREGTLIVNLIDAKTKKSAWGGMARENLNGPGSGKQKVGPAAAAIFKKFPIKDVKK
jgi:hypothetical protein